MATLFTLPRQVKINVAGRPYAGAQAFFYQTGTETPQLVYQDSDLSIPHPQPVLADDDGYFPVIWMDPDAEFNYRVRILSATGSQLEDVQDVPARLVSATQVAEDVATTLDSLKRTQTEIDEEVTPVNYAWPEGYVDRYGDNTVPGTTDMTVAIQTAVDIAHAKATGGNVYFRPTTYRTTAPITFPVTSVRVHIHGNGAVFECDHNGNGINWIVSNENYSAHTIEKLTLNGPNAFLPTEPGYTPPSAGAGISMNRATTSNSVTAYNNVIRDVTIQGFEFGLDMRNSISLNVYGSAFQYNQYGVYISGGQTNANHFFGTHIRYNRVTGIRSDGATGGSLSNATTNTFHGCLIESNIAYVEGAFPSGGTPPTDNTAIYLNNSYGFIFDACYIENHSASIYLTNGSKFNQFLRCDIYPGGSNSRVSAIYLDGSGIYSNVFDVTFHSAAATDVTVIANSSAQLYNRFSGSGINFIAGSIIANLDYSDVKPDLNYVPAYGVGLVRMPSQGYAQNVSEGTNPGQINGIGTGTASLNAFGLGEINIGNGITSATSIATVTRLAPNSLFVLRSTQAAFAVTLKAAAFGNAGGQDVVLNTGGQVITYWVNGDGVPREIGRNFASSPAYTVTNPNARRSFDTTTITTAQLAEVVGTLYSDLKARGLLT